VDVIVNADDLGISREVNDATFELMKDGAVTSATIMANGPDVEAACQQTHEFPNCSFGVHLNVTEFSPLTTSGDLGPLLDSDNRFIGEQVRRIKIDSKLANGIFAEYCAQIEKVKSLGVTPSHLDSHNYVHTVARIFPILKRVQKRYGLRKVRLSRNIYADRLMGKNGLNADILGLDPSIGGQDIGTGLRMKKAFYNFMLRNYYRTKTTDGFSGFRLFYEYAKSHKMGQGTFEVVVHPANDYYDSSEVEILKGPWRDELKVPVRLINYRELS